MAGAQGMFAVTPSGLSRATVPTSAYPGHYPRHSLLEESQYILHTVDTCSDLCREQDVVTLFLMLVLPSLRVVLSAGFSGSRYWSEYGLPAPILSLLGQALEPA